MKKNSLYFLTIALVIASIIIAGCFTSNQTNQKSNTNTSTSTANTTTATSTTSTTATSTIKPSTSPTPTPTPSARITTSIQFASDPGRVKQGTIISLGIEVIAPSPPAPQPLVCNHGAVEVKVDGKKMGTVTMGPSDCFRTAYFELDTSSLQARTDPYPITLSFLGDSVYLPSQSMSTISII